MLYHRCCMCFVCVTLGYCKLRYQEWTCLPFNEIYSSCNLIAEVISPLTIQRSLMPILHWDKHWGDLSGCNIISGARKNLVPWHFEWKTSIADAQVEIAYKSTKS